MAEARQHDADRVVATANRLRLIQTDLADEPDDVRQQYLIDEVERALGEVVPAERPAFLDALAACFPTWDTLMQAGDGGGSGTDGGTAGTPELDLDDALALAERLASLATGLSEAERSGIAQRLRDAGLSADGAAWPEHASVTAAEQIGLADGQRLDPARSVEALRMLATLTISLDQLVWSTWKAIAPRSEVRGQGELPATLRAFLAGDPDQARGDVTASVERLRQLTAALVSAIGQASQQFAERHHERFAPEVIEAWAKQEKKALESLPVAAWRRYAALASEVDSSAIEHDIQQQIAASAERLMRGLTR